MLENSHLHNKTTTAIGEAKGFKVINNPRINWVQINSHKASGPPIITVGETLLKIKAHGETNSKITAKAGEFLICSYIH